MKGEEGEEWRTDDGKLLAIINPVKSHGFQVLLCYVLPELALKDVIHYFTV